MEVRTCQKCGAIHPATDRFCPSCGWDSTVEYVKQVGPSQVDYKRAFRAVAVFLGIVIVVVACILINQGGNSPALVTAVASPIPTRTPTPTVTPIFTLPPATPPPPVAAESKSGISKSAMKNFIDKSITLAYKGNTYIVDILTPVSGNGYIISPQLDSELFTCLLYTSRCV